MKSFRDFTAVRKEVKDQGIRDQYYREEIYKEGEWVLTEKGHVGKIIRRGPNYLICLTAEETKFRTWVKDVKEVFEIGTDAHRQYVMSLTPGQKVQKPAGTVAVKQTIPTDPKKDKMDNHESLVQAAVKALNEYSPVPPVKKTPVGKEGTANKNPKGTGGAKGVGGGDAPGMKMAEPKGTKGKPTIKKPKHACATKVEHPEWGAGNCLKEQHTLDEEGTVTHYDVMFEHGLEQDVPVPTLNILVSEMHEHVINTDKQEVEEGLDPVNPVAVKKKYKDRKDKDLDNDGDTDSSDKYLHKKRKAISKAMKKEGYGMPTKKKKQDKRNETVGEHHEKDADGKVIEHEVEDTTPASVEEEKKGLYANIHAKRKRGESPAKPGDEDYPAKNAFKKAAKTAKKEEVEVDESMKQARKNVGASTCWDGYKAKGTKMKGGKKVPNCVKEFSEWRAITEKSKRSYRGHAKTG